MTTAMDELKPPPGGLKLADKDRVSVASVAAADHVARHWTAEVAGPIAIGSDLHKRVTCRMFRETFNPYKPTIIDWPELTPEARDDVSASPEAWMTARRATRRTTISL